MKNPFKKKVPTNDYILTFVKREKKKNMLCKEEREKVPLYGLTEEEYVTILKLLRLLELKSGNNYILVPNSLSIRVVGDVLATNKMIAAFPLWSALVNNEDIVANDVAKNKNSKK